MLTLEQFKNARSTLQGVLRPTPLIYSPYLSKTCGNYVYLKPENMQVTGAYKLRGAYFKISTLTDEEKARGLVTASAGNHAQGVAYAAQAAGVAATIVMPTTTPLVKVNNTKDYGAQVILHGEVFDDAAELAARMAEEQGLTYVHPFNDLTLATGQGTIAYEIFQDLPDVDVILVPIGGGGLAAGVATLAKLLNPQVEVVGVEPTGAASMKASLEAGHIVTLPSATTIADGVAVKTPGDKVFPYIHRRRRAGGGLFGCDGAAQDGGGERGAAHRRRSAPPGLQGEKCSVRPVRGQHGCHHHGLSSPARAHLPGPYLHLCRPASRPPRRADAGGRCTVPKQRQYH